MVDPCYERYERMMQRHTKAIHQLGGIAEPGRASSYTFARWLDIAEGWREVAEFCSRHGDLERASWAARLYGRITKAVVGESTRQARLTAPYRPPHGSLSARTEGSKKRSKKRKLD